MPELRTQDLLLNALAGFGNSTKFCAFGALPIVLPGLEIAGQGDIGVPVSAHDAKRLIEYAEQAPYGLGEATIVDTNVRRVWQIGAESLALSNPGWQSFVSDIVDQVAEEFGIKQTVKAELYKLLVYEPGSFFKAHRDTEKSPGMFATLVIVLPSKHVGGELIISHAGQTERLRFDGKDSAFNVQFAAFYADCEHEVTSVESGYRVCLVYNLSIPKRKKQPSAPDQSGSVPKVQELLSQLFAEDNREKIAIPLAHQYSAEGLTLGILKGADSALVDVLARACDAGNFEAHLAALEIHQSGSPDYSTVELRSYRSRRWDNEDEIDEENSKSAEFEEICEEERKIVCLIRANGEPTSVGRLSIDDDELIATDPLDSWPHEQSVSEATGNEGASMERWYRRTCVLIWPKARAFAVLAKEGPGTAIPELQRLIKDTKKPRQSTECHDFAAAILKHWVPHEVGSRFDSKKNASADRSVMFAKLMAELGDAELLAAFLTKILPVECNGDEGTHLVRLLDELGWAPHRERLRKVLAQQSFAANSHKHEIKSHAILFEQLCCLPPKLSSDRLEVCRVLAQEMDEVLASWDNAPKTNWQSDRLERSELVRTFINAFAATGESERLDRFIQRIIEQPHRYPLDKLLIPAIHELFSGTVRNDLKALARERLRAHAIAELQKLTTSMPQPPSDWTREGKIDCKCKDCQELNAFLKNPAEQSHGFARLQSVRSHLEQQIERRKSDLTFHTVKVRSPHTLLCTKTDATYRRCLAEYEANLKKLADLEALTATVA